MSAATLGEVVSALGGDLVGDASLAVDRLASIDAAGPGALSFLAHPRYAGRLATTQATAVIVGPDLRDAAVARGAAIVVDQPYLYYARLTQWWARRYRPVAATGVHPSAVVGQGVDLAPSASIGPFVVIEDGARIGEHAVIGAHAVIGRHATIGSGTRLAPRVTLGDHCRIGAHGIVHGGVVIGADGFGFAPDQGQWVKIEQLGAVRIGDDVEIGANTCIDRGALEDTVIEDGVKLDNQIQIAHNVHVGAYTAMAACAGVAGSARIGRYCQIGGAAMIHGHIEIVDHTIVSAGTLISRSIRQAGMYSGVYPFDDNRAWEKNAATLRQLHTLRDRLRALEKKIP